MMDIRAIVCIVLATLLPNFTTPLTCPPGKFLYNIVHTGEQFCIECDDGKFIPYEDHQQTSCRPCVKIKEPELEIVVSPCTKTQDAVIHCVDGYYRDRARNPRDTEKCKKCTDCKFTGQPCSTYRDAVCCPDVNFDVIPNHNGDPVCKERPWFCRRGQYFETRYYYCSSCPDNTFMPLDYHIEPECWKCREYDKYKSYRPLHSAVVQSCNSTHAPVIRCEDGFFIKSNMGYRGNALGCSPCTDCSTTDVQYEGRKCENMEDTVCCPEANMAVIDTPKGPVCTSPPITSDEGPCLHDNTKNVLGTCAPCSHETDVDDTKQTKGNGEGHGQDVSWKEKDSKDDQCDCEHYDSGHVTMFVLGLFGGFMCSSLGYVVYTMVLKKRNEE